MIAALDWAPESESMSEAGSERVRQTRSQEPGDQHQPEPEPDPEWRQRQSGQSERVSRTTQPSQHIVMLTILLLGHLWSGTLMF